MSSKQLISYGIILEDEILYCSNNDKYNVFEIVLFVEKLLRGFNPKRTWRLNNIFLKSPSDEKERIIIRHLLTETNESLFIFVSGYFEEGSQEIRNMLGDFFDKIKAYYPTAEVIKKCSKKPIFKEIIKIMTDYLWSKYEILLEHEEIKVEVNPGAINKLLYCGISTQGLPIITKLFDTSLLQNLNKEINPENIDLFNSSLSAQLATIEMNTLIRAQASIKEIHIADLEDKKNKKIILYDSIGKYSLAVFASGNFFEITDLMKILKHQISKEKVLDEEFSGDLKPFRYLEKFFSDLDKEFA